MNEKRIPLFAICLFSIVLSGFSHENKSIKATWIWQTDLIDTEREEILAFCEEKGINLIYLNVNPEDPFEKYRPFVREAVASGIEIHAVGGHPKWALASHASNIRRLTDWVKAYNDAVSEGEKLAGIHLDVSPYLLPQWKEDRENVLSEWKQNVLLFVREAREQPDLQVSASLAFWLDQVPMPEASDVSLSEWLIGKMDHVTLLAYRDRAEGINGILPLVSEEMEAAKERGKKAMIAVNIKPVGFDHVSFAEEGLAEMNRQLDRVTVSFKEHSAFAGVAVHDYRYWSSLRKAPLSGDEVRGTYVWHAERAVYEQDEILSFAKEKEINFLYVRLDLNQPFTAYRDFVSRAREAGIEVHAMGGHPKWALSKHRPRMLRLVRYVKEYNAAAEEGEAFSGIHLDIEPYVMPEWKDNREDVLVQWMENIRIFVRETKEDSQLKASADMAMWFDDIPTPGQPDLPFNRWFIQQFDHTSVMAFRDYLDGRGGIVDMAENEIRHAADLGKSIIISVEMKPNEHVEHITFHQEGEAEMQRQLSQLPERVGHHASYRGVVVHAYDYWKNAKE